MKICLDISECNGLGDLLCATPVIRKLSMAYEKPITVLSKMPELFKKNPYVEKSYKKESVDVDYFYSNYLIHNSFYNLGLKNNLGIEYKHNIIDIRQYHAINLGFQLKDDELECFYRPVEERSQEFLYENYIVIHPVKSWSTRTWAEENWMNFISSIKSISTDIKIIALGKNSSETGYFNLSKPTYQLQNTDFIDLMNKTSISQSWHILNHAKCVVTMDTGILHLAGTTDTHIIHLGSSIDPYYRKPYRASMPDKYDYVHGTCGIFCGSNMKYGVNEWGNIQGVPPLIDCLEKKPTYECHPSVQQVTDIVSKILHI